MKKRRLSHSPPSQTAPGGVRSSNVIYISCNYPQEGYLVRHMAEAYAKMEHASRSSQTASHCVSLKLLKAALLILMLPWLHLVNPAFVSLWMDSSDSPASQSHCVCLLICIFTAAFSDICDHISVYHWHLCCRGGLCCSRHMLKL